ncbi:MAG: hypothetical protein ACFCVB_02370, partial [Nodosilinea sp.]
MIRSIRTLLISILGAIFLAGLLIVVQINSAIAQTVPASGITYENFFNTTFSELGATPVSGSIPGLPPELVGQTGFDTARTWQSG